MMNRLLWLAQLGCLCALLSGCALSGGSAERTTRDMLDPATSPRQEILLQEHLIALAPDSDRFLAEAFFPIGLYDVPEEALPEVAAAGFNTVVNGGKDASYLARAQALGLRVIPYIDMAHMAADVASAAGRRTLFAWYLFDEPDLNALSATAYLELVKLFRAAESRRPLFLTVQSPDNYADYAAGCDILAVDPYPIQHLAPELNDLRRVPQWIEAARAAAGPKPVWAVMQAFFAAPMWPRNPTPQELRAMVFMALNHRASGIVFFSYKSGDRPITQHADLFPAIERLVGEINALRGPLLAPPTPVDFNVQVLEEQVPPAAPKPPEDRAPLDCSLRTFMDAQLFIAVNPDFWKKTTRLSMPPSVVGKSLVEIFPDSPTQPLTVPRTHPFDITFEPYQTRIFWTR
ncbi:MAG: hypothetical protein ABSA67_06375 [Candidatus Brocadiia bacterium]|jgi:hypothetical protein